MAPPIPDRWLNYKPVGKQIEGTRFIAFKVPLREHVVKAVEKDNRLDGDSLLRDIPNLGLIIDLTNTDRYYDPEFFRRAGVEHIKLMIPGHVTPPDDLVNKFKLYALSFLNKNKDNDKLIGVHCTHGVNRTGYLICNYMISELLINPKEAITRFDAARGHNIERSNYLQALQELSKTIIISPTDRSRRSISDRETYNKNDRTERKRYRDESHDRIVRNSNGKRYRDDSHDRIERKRYRSRSNSKHREVVKKTNLFKTRAGGDDYQCSYGRQNRDAHVYHQRNEHIQPRSVNQNRFKDRSPHGDYNKPPSSSHSYRTPKSYDAPQTSSAYKHGERRIAHGNNRHNPFSSDIRVKHHSIEDRNYGAPKRYDAPKSYGAYRNSEGPVRPQRFSSINHHRKPYIRDEHSSRSNKFDRNDRHNQSRPFTNNWKSTRN